MTFSTNEGKLLCLNRQGLIDDIEGDSGNYPPSTRYPKPVYAGA